MGIDSNAEARTARTQRIFRALRARGESTLAELAKAADISRPTASSIIADLEAAGVVAQTSTSSGAGRPAAVYDFAPRHGFALALDIQRDHVAILAASLAGDILHSSVAALDTIAREERLEALASIVNNVVAALEKEHGKPVAGFASTTGIVDGEGVILRSYLVPQWHDVNLADELRRRVGLEFGVDNDINTASYGEFMHAAADGEVLDDDTVLYFRLFAGFRSGLVLRGEVHHGEHWHAGEVNDSLNIHLQARTDTEEDAHGWSLRAATMVAAISSVIDPAMVVLSTDSIHDSAVGHSIRRHLEEMRLPTAPRLRIVDAQLGRAAASLGALSLALRAAENRYLPTVASHPIAPRSTIEAIEQLEHWITSHKPDVPRRAADISEPLRIGVVGMGMRAQLARHAEDHDAVIVAACDPDPQAHQRADEILGKDPATFPVVATVRELIELGIGAAFVTSPDDTHAQVAGELLEAGIPVYLEKPIATTLDGATRILMTAFENKTKLYVGHNMRHMSFVRQMRKLIHDGSIGEVKTIWCRHFVGNGGDYYFKDWHADRRHSNGLLLQKAAHDIDVMHWLAGSYAREVVGMGDLMVYGDAGARGRRPGQLMHDWFSLDNWPASAQQGLNEVIDVEDVSMLMMRMSSGVLAAYQQCHFSPDYWRNYTVIGSEGRLENIGDGEGGVIKLWNRRSFFNADGDEQFPIQGDKEGHDDADALTVAEFLEFVRHGASTDTSPLGAWQSVAAGIQATESLRDGSTPRTVPDLPVELVEYFNANQEA